MSVLAALFHFLVAIYRSIVAVWNACVLLLRVIQSVVQEAKQEAAELMALFDDGAPIMDAITSPSVLHDAGDAASTWQMLIVARASSFVLLLRLSKRRVLHLEVDESFIAAKLEVIRTGLMLHVQHIPRLLQVPIGTHDTQLVRYMPTRLPYVWKEEQAGPGVGGVGAVERSVASVAPASSVSTGEGRSHRKKYVQLLTESALRRRMRKDRVERAAVDAVPKEMSTLKAQRETVAKRKVLGNATNIGTTHGEGNTGVDGASDKAYAEGTGAADTPKQVRSERNVRGRLSENLSITNLAQASSSSSLRQMVESASQSHRISSQSLRRKRGQFDLYAQGVSSEFSLLSGMGQGRD